MGVAPCRTRLYDQPFTFEGLGATMWYVYMHGIFGDADDVVQQPRHDEPLWEPAESCLIVAGWDICCAQCQWLLQFCWMEVDL